MTGEDMERAIEFLLQSQANHEARLGQLTDNVKEQSQQIAETNKIVQLNAETQTQFIQIVTRHIEAQGEINASLRAALKQNDAALKHNDASINRTDARLDRLEALVERYIEGREGRN